MRLLSFYTDEQIPRGVVRGLRERGFDVVTAIEALGLGAADVDHLRAAADAVRVMVTRDADFLRLASQGVPHAGIVYFRQGVRIGDMIRWLVLLAEVTSGDEMANHIEFF